MLVISAIISAWNSIAKVHCTIRRSLESLHRAIWVKNCFFPFNFFFFPPVQRSIEYYVVVDRPRRYPDFVRAFEVDDRSFPGRPSVALIAITTNEHHVRREKSRKPKRFPATIPHRFFRVGKFRECSRRFKNFTSQSETGLPGSLFLAASTPRSGTFRREYSRRSLKIDLERESRSFEFLNASVDQRARLNLDAFIESTVIFISTMSPDEK